MIYVIKTANNDVILFDSVLAFSESYQGSVTSHPVEDGSKISDNVTVENVKIKIQGVVTDYNFFNPIKDAGNQKVPGYDYPRQYGSMLINTKGEPETNANVAIPSDYSGTDNDGNVSVKAAMEVVKQRLIAIQQNKEFITVLGYNTDGKDSEINKFSNCIITDVAFNQNPESGYAIYPDITIEQVNVVKVKVLSASSDKIVNDIVNGQASGEDGKGSQLPSGGKAGETSTNKSNQQKKLGGDVDPREYEIQRCLEETARTSKTSRVVPLCVLRLGISNLVKG